MTPFGQALGLFLGTVPPLLFLLICLPPWLTPLATIADRYRVSRIEAFVMQAIGFVSSVGAVSGVVVTWVR